MCSCSPYAEHDVWHPAWVRSFRSDHVREFHLVSYSFCSAECPCATRGSANKPGCVLSNKLFFFPAAPCTGSTFFCHSNMCINSSLVCNGIQNCAYPWDENHCKGECAGEGQPSWEESGRCPSLRNTENDLFCNCAQCSCFGWNGNIEYKCSFKCIIHLWYVVKAKKNT